MRDEQIGLEITIVLMEIHGNQARIGIDAPRSIQITRDNAKVTLPSHKGRQH